MRRKLLIGVSSLCFVAAIALLVFAGILYKDNGYERRLHNEYYRRGYEGSEPKMTTTNLVLIGLGVLSGASGLFCLVRARKTKTPG